MKKLLIAFALMIITSLSTSATALADTRYWQVQMMTPAASSSNHTLNVAYSVLSTISTDVYDVSLYQNEVLVGTQHVDHGKGGNSGAFDINMPTNGTYTYEISADNTSANETKTTDTKTVQIVNGPSPTVTTVTVNTASTAGQATPSANTSSPTAADTTGTSGADQTNNSAIPGTQSTGTVGDNGVSTKNNNQSGSTLGATTTRPKAKSKAAWWYAGGASILAVAAIYWFGIRPRLNA